MIFSLLKTNAATTFDVGEWVCLVDDWRQSIFLKTEKNKDSPMEVGIQFSENSIEHWVYKRCCKMEGGPRLGRIHENILTFLRSKKNS